MGLFEAHSLTPHSATHSAGQSDAVALVNLSGNLTQARSHDSPDTDAAPTSLHHTLGTGANQACAGNDTRLSPSNADMILATKIFS